MSDNIKPPFLDLLELSGFTSFLVGGNFSFFTSLKQALLADDKSVLTIDDVATPLPCDLNDTDGLFQKETDFLLALIESWGLSVVTPLLTALNEYTPIGEAELSIYFEGYLHDAKLYFDNTQGFIDSLNTDDVKGIKSLLSEWSNTVGEFGNLTELEDLLGAV